MLRVRLRTGPLKRTWTGRGELLRKTACYPLGPLTRGVSGQEAAGGNLVGNSRPRLRNTPNLLRKLLAAHYRGFGYQALAALTTLAFLLILSGVAQSIAR
jgi:hypothetical protein